MYALFRSTARTWGLAVIGISSSTLALYPRAEEAANVAPPHVSTILETAENQQSEAVSINSNSSPSPSTSEYSYPRRFAGAFLNAEGKTTLLNSFKPIHREVIQTPNLTVAYDPKGAALARLATQLGRPVDLKVSAIISDKHAHTAVVEVVKATDDDDGGIPFMLENTTPHVTISIAGNEHDGYGPFYSNHLLSRAKAAAGDLDHSWKGILPARDGYEETECEITIPEERTILTATLCVSDQWNAEASRCGEEKGCGFCRFMKLGPCGKEFAAWETCIDECKETEEDFVDKCAHQTMKLKSCVDVNPDYYYSVLDGDENNKSSVETEVENADNEPQSSKESSSSSTLGESNMGDTEGKSSAGDASSSTKFDEDNYMTKG
jgi:abnormal spindle-like microcephaly-associated protein